MLIQYFTNALEIILQSMYKFMLTVSSCAQELVRVGDCKRLSVIIANSNKVLTYGIALEITATMLPNCQFPSSM